MATLVRPSISGDEAHGWSDHHIVANWEIEKTHHIIIKLVNCASEWLSLDSLATRAPSALSGRYCWRNYRFRVGLV